MENAPKKWIVATTVLASLAGSLFVANLDAPLSKLDDKEVIDAIEQGGEVRFAYKGKSVAPKLSVKEVVEKRTEHSFTEELAPNTFRTRSFSGAAFFKEGATWHEVEYGTTTKQDFDEKLDIPLSRLLTGRVYAATVFSGAGDGTAYNSAIPTWVGAHDAAAGSFSSATGQNIVANTNTNGDYFVGRGFIPFDTSSIPANSTITAATFNGYVTSKFNAVNDGNDWINIIQTSQASETTLDNADFDQAGAIDNPTEGATRIDIGSVTTSAYNVWTLDSTGRSWIKKTGETSNCGVTAGWTCLGIREGHDASDITPTGINNITVLESETSGTSQDPYLDITYTIPTGDPSDISVGGTASILIKGSGSLYLK